MEKKPLVLTSGQPEQLQSGDQVPIKNLNVVATRVGQVLYSKDGTDFVPTTPLCGATGWLSNNDGTLLYPGE
jgi:hypothetical protein